MVMLFAVELILERLLLFLLLGVDDRIRVEWSDLTEPINMIEVAAAAALVVCGSVLRFRPSQQPVLVAVVVQLLQKLLMLLSDGMTVAVLLVSW